MTMKKTIALILAMMFVLCSFVTAFATNGTTDAANNTTAAETTAANTTSVATTNDDAQDGFDSTTAANTTAAGTTAAGTTEAGTTEAGTTAAGTTAAGTTAAGTTGTTLAPDVTVTLAPGQTSYEGQDTATTTKKPAAVDNTIPSTGSGVVVPAIALLALAAGTVAVIKTKKED